MSEVSSREAEDTGMNFCQAQSFAPDSTRVRQRANLNKTPEHIPQIGCTEWAALY